jgi:RNA polymerase sigma factor (sigma-70 family)
MTVRQRKLVADYAARWPSPVAVARRCWPGDYYRAVAAGLHETDIESAAWAAVVHAAYRFDPARGMSFASYAHQWMRGKLGHAVRSAEAEKMRNHARGLLPGDYRLPGGDSLWDLLGPAARPTGEEPEERERVAELRRLVAEGLRRLDPRRRQALTLRYGLDGRPPMMLKDVGREMGLTRERVRQLELSAFARMREALATAYNVRGC